MNSMVALHQSPVRAGSSLRLPADHLPRPRLHHPLLQADCLLRLLCAPAGCGKSVLLKECLLQRPEGTRLVYLELRGKALSTESFLRYLGRQLGLEECSASSIRQHLESDVGFLWLALDDYPRFPDEALDALLNELLLSSSCRVNWWIASRRRPELQLSRLLLDGELFEVGAADLALNTEELGGLLESHSQGVDEHHIAALHRTTQGWCAGTRLHLLGLNDAKSSTTLAPGDSRLLDYLHREVLDELPESWCQALLILAQLQCFDHSLCEQVLGTGEGGALLESLLACGAFIEPAPQGVHLYQLQPMQAQALASLLPASTATSVYRQACQWYMSQDMVRPALAYAIKAGQMETAACLMQRYSEDQLLQGRSLADLMAWRRAMPEELLYSSPRLLLLNAWALMFGGHLDEAEPFVEALARYAPQPSACRQRELLGQWQALRGFLAVQRGRADLARELLTEAVQHLPERAWAQHLFCSALLVELGLIDGRFEEAMALNHTATKQAREHASLALESMLVLGHIKVLELHGEASRIESLLKRLHDELCHSWDGEPSPMHGQVQLRLGTLLLQQGRFAEAQHRLREGRDECAACGDPAVLWGYLGLAELAALQGDVDAAFRHLEDAERLMQYQHVDELLYRGLLLRAKVRLWLVQGRVEQADRALISMPEAVLHCSPLGVPDLHLHLQLLRIRVCLAREQFEPALSQLATMHAQAVAEGRRPLACEIGFCLAEGFYAWNRPGQAKQALLDTLVLARQLKLTTSERVFSQRFPALMRSARESSRGETEAVELLSRRERDVLKLIAYGMSNQEIAERLCISLHTVKTHAQRIHFKLGVERRTQALARAKELGLV